MKFVLDTQGTHFFKTSLKIVSAFSNLAQTKSTSKKTSSQKAKIHIEHWPEETLKEEFNGLKSKENFKASKDETLSFTTVTGDTVWVVGLNENRSAEDVRKSVAQLYKAAKAKHFSEIAFHLPSFLIEEDEIKTTEVISEAIHLSDYHFDKYKSHKENSSAKKQTTIVLGHLSKNHLSSAKKTVEKVRLLGESINFSKDLINEVPNVLHSEEYAKRIEMDAKKNLKGVKVKILGKAQLKREKMGMFLAVNSGSAYEPKLVHLTYTPARSSSKTPHVALVGKGITFDTGGYSLKPSGSIMGMKFDMGGSATVYGAFRAAVLQKSPLKISCFLALTDNAINSLATFPDSIVTARNGKTVEILNTDAEGRLILGDTLDYACDFKPDYLIDAATLTGACLVALGNQVCAVLGNHQEFVDELLQTAKHCDEYMWQLPIIEEWKQDMKSKVADLKNIGTPMRAGTATAAAFLSEFVREGVKWAHLDIAGIADSQSHLPYCSPHGASGLIIRTLTHFLTHGK